MTQAQQLKEAGQALAAKKAGADWYGRALRHLQLYIRGRYDHRFTFDGFRTWALARGLSEPDSLNAWGALPRVARADGLCEATSETEAAQRPASHGRLVRVWRAL